MIFVMWIPTNINTLIKWMEKLKVCFKLCMFRIHACFSNEPFRPTIFFWCPLSCHCLNWDNLLYQYLQPNYISSIFPIYIWILLHSNVCLFFNIFHIKIYIVHFNVCISTNTFIWRLTIIYYFVFYYMNSMVNVQWSKC